MFLCHAFILISSMLTSLCCYPVCLLLSISPEHLIPAHHDGPSEHKEFCPRAMCRNSRAFAMYRRQGRSRPSYSILRPHKLLAGDAVSSCYKRWLHKWTLEWLAHSSETLSSLSPCLTVTSKDFGDPQEIVQVVCSEITERCCESNEQLHYQIPTKLKDKDLLSYNMTLRLLNSLA